MNFGVGRTEAFLARSDLFNSIHQFTAQTDSRRFGTENNTKTLMVELEGSRKKVKSINASLVEEIKKLTSAFPSTWEF